MAGSTFDATSHPGLDPRPTDDSKDLVTQLEDRASEHEKPQPIEVQNLVYADDEHEPKLHARTWIALVALCTQQFIQSYSILGPPAILDIIAADVNAGVATPWIPNAPVLMQAVFSNILSSASDLFQARKSLLVACTALSFVGAAVAPGSHSVGRLIAAQCLIGASNAGMALTYTIPSEILPTKWRSMAQSAVTGAGFLGMITGPLVAGALSKRNIHSGWRNFYWVQCAIWGAATLFLLVGYRPPRRHTRLDHLTFWQKIGQIDLLGGLLLASGLCLFLTGLSIGGGQYPWTSAVPLSTLVVGLAVLVGFGLYEWKGTKTGIVHHQLFNHDKAMVRTFIICLILVFVEGIVVFSFILFYPTLTRALFEQDLVLVSARVVIFYAACTIGTFFFGYMTLRLRSVRESLGLGYFIWLISTIGFATIQPGDNANMMAFAGVGGFGLGAVLSQAVAGAQLASPYAHLATATGLSMTSRAIGAAVFTSIYSAVVSRKLASYIPSYITKAALAAGLNAESAAEFEQAIAGAQPDQALEIPGVTQVLLRAGTRALQQAYADAIRYVFIIAAAFALVATVLCWWLVDFKKIMTYHVDAPVEKLTAKVDHDKATLSA